MIYGCSISVGEGILMYASDYPHSESHFPESVDLFMKWDISESLAFIAEVYYTWDDNQVIYVSDFRGLNVLSQFTDPNVLGMNLVAQARF